MVDFWLLSQRFSKMPILKRDFLIGILVTAPAVTGFAARAAAQEQQGRFIGNVVARWNPDGREMTLTEPFEYIDPNGLSWKVPVGTSVDGASIPQIFWSLIGGPFDGMYRNASVVHDFYCQVRTRPYRNVHRVFREAMHTSGVPQSKSWLMYQAVNRFGPRWSDFKSDPKCQVIDADYDFDACSRNAAPPLPAAEVNRENLDSFIGDVEGNASPEDVIILRRALAEVR
ncbi:DUF1353 domain-containing protein [Sinorhizobium medicae]|nr:DUF1353 domain-containing protein [Sinorhizobium medicae]